MALDLQPGNGNDQLSERQKLQADFLRGDIAKSIMELVQHTKDHYKKLSEGDQRDVIHRIQSIANDLVEGAVRIVATKGFDHYMVKIPKYDCDGAIIKCTLTIAHSPEAAAAIDAMVNRSVALILRDADQFKGEQTKLRPDVVGSLKIPVATEATTAQPTH